MKIIDYRTIKDNLNNILKDDIFKENLERFNKDIDEKLKNFKPTFIIYGDYNCGKSTLLNSLFGDERAEMGDKVTTKKVHSYEYKGFIIYDTPGLSATIDDDKVTSEQLLKSEIVLFVLSNDNIEVNSVYEKVAIVLKSKKPILIVVNNKAGIELNGIENEKICQKIISNLQSKIANLDADNCKIISINAKSALKGKLENKKLLLENSGYPRFEKTILDLMKTTNETSVQNALNDYIKEYVTKFIKICDNRFEGEKQQKISQIVDFLQKQKSNLKIILSNIIISYIHKLKMAIYEILSSNSPNEVAILNVLSTAIENINSQVECIIKEKQNEIASKIENFNNEYKHLSQGDIYIDLSELKMDSKSESSLIPDEVKNGALKIVNDKELIAQTTKVTLEFIKQKLPSLMVGKGKVWIENMSTVAGKYAGSIVAVIASGYEIYTAMQEHDKQVQMQKHRAYTIQNSANQISSDFEMNLNKQFENLVSDMLNPLIEMYQNLLNNLSKNNDKFISIKQELSFILEKI